MLTRLKRDLQKKYIHEMLWRDEEETNKKKLFLNTCFSVGVLCLPSYAVSCLPIFSCFV